MIQFSSSKASSKSFVRKAIHTTYNKYSISHVGVFAPLEKQIQVCVSLNENSFHESQDLILTITDINNRSIRLSSQAQNFQKDKILFSQSLEHLSYEGPFRIELFQKKESADFEKFKFDVWYLQEQKVFSRPGLFSRIGKYFPAPNKN